ncbi:hypothetical protein V6N13_079130 [Hibiscus sabdariffa]
MLCLQVWLTVDLLTYGRPFVRFGKLSVLMSCGILGMGRKLISGTIRNVDHLWVQVLRGKYNISQAMPASLVSCRPSHLWKVICSVWETVRLNVVWNIGDGQQVDFWNDPWLESLGPLVVYLRNPGAVGSCTVATMVDELGNWDWPKLQPLLPHNVLLHLSAIKPPRSGFTCDFPGWARSHDRTFSVRSAYEALRDSSLSVSNAAWKVIAGFRGLQRIKTFLWLLAKDRLLTNAERVRRHLSSSARCEACGAAVESAQHIFRECPIAVAVWKGLIKRDKWVEFMSLGSLEWIRRNLSSPTHFAIALADWDLHFGVILWSLWTRRNAIIFDPDSIDMLSVSDRSRWLWDDMRAVCALEGNPRSDHASIDGVLPSSRANARWVSPPMDWVKLNVDGARDHGTDFAACGGLIRDHDGRWVRGFARSVGICSPIEFELWAVHEGLVQAWVLGLKRVVVEVDSTLVLRLLSQRSCRESSMTIVQHIFSLLSRDWSIKFVHAYRESNAVADSLAKSVALGLLEFRIFVDPSHFIFALLQVDCMTSG